MVLHGKVNLRKPDVEYMIRLRRVLQKQKQRHFNSVLNLVGKMLEPDRRTRATALNLMDTLEEIHKQNTKDSEAPTKKRSTSNASSRSVVRLSVIPPDRRSPEPLPQEGLTVFYISSNIST